MHVTVHVTLLANCQVFYFSHTLIETFRQTIIFCVALASSSFYCDCILLFIILFFQNLQGTEEEGGPKKSGRRGSQTSLPSPAAEDREGAGSSDCTYTN